MFNKIILLFLCIFLSACSDIKVTQLDPEEQKDGSSALPTDPSAPNSALNPIDPNSPASSGSDQVDLNAGPISGDHQGTILVPRPGADTVNDVLTDIAESTIGSSCSNVPEGYQALPYTLIEILDNSGAVLNSTTTTICGEFGLDIPQGAFQIRYTNSNCHVLVKEIGNIQVHTIAENQISMITNDSGISIDAIHRLDSNHLAFSIKDLVTDKAILGVDIGLIQISINGVLSGVIDLTYASYFSKASVGLALDLSGSMDSDIDSTNIAKHSIVGLAGHRFIDLKSPLDEIAFNIFSSDVNHIDSNYVSALNLSWPGSPSSLPHTASGFSTDEMASRFTLDFYNPNSELHGGSDSIHTSLLSQYGSISLSNFTSPWHGGTALFDAIGNSVEKTDLRPNDRKFVVVLTDGHENGSNNYTSSQQIIDLAVNKGIPVHTLGFGSDFQIDKFELENIASQTGGTFRQIQSVADVASAFESIQTNIRFEYVIESLISINPGDSIEISVDIAGKTVSHTHQL